MQSTPHQAVSGSERIDAAKRNRKGELMPSPTTPAERLIEEADRCETFALHLLEQATVRTRAERVAHVGGEEKVVSCGRDLGVHCVDVREGG
jgi:hypothetical protein